MIVKYKKLHPAAKTPSYVHLGDAGMDVYATSKIEKKQYIEYGTGLAFELTPGFLLLTFPRSSISNTDLMLVNGIGVLDSGYRGELLLRFRKFGNNIYEVGDRIAQIIILPHPQIEFTEVADLTSTTRGKGGFGSTGKK